MELFKSTVREDRRRKKRYGPTITNPGLPRIARELADKAKKGRTRDDSGKT